jgi:hypothetical protein
MLNTCRINNPIFTGDRYARFSLTDYTMNKLCNKDGNLKIVIYKDDKFVGGNTINRKQWIKTCKLKEKVVKLRPDEPLQFFYNDMAVKTKAELDDEILKQALI